MRRSGRPSMLPLALAALVLAAWPASGIAQDPAAGAASATGDRGARLSVDIPPDAAPSGTTIQVVARHPDERPDDLRSVPLTWTFFELLPADARFGAPVTVTRATGFEELGLDAFDPLTDGVPIAALVSRDPDGTWSWLDDPQVRLDVPGTTVTVTATTGHGGPIIATAPGSLLVAAEDDAPTPVGSTFRVEGQLQVDATSRATILAVTGTTSDPAIATPGDSYVVATFDRANGLAFQCLAPGSVTYETTFTVRAAIDIGPLVDAIGLAGPDVAVIRSGTHTCG